MATQDTMKMATAKEVQVPEWEHVASRRAGDDGAVKMRPRISFRSAFDTVVPPHKKYIGMSRRNFLFVLLGVFFVFLVLVISLAVGLPRQKYHKNLPLPSNHDHFTGDLTYYEPGLGACGMESTSADKIVSLSHIVFDAAGSSSSTGGNSNANPLCGKMIRAQRYNEEARTNRSVDLKVVDRCTGCQPTDIDTTTSVFSELAEIADGRVSVSWAWL